MREETWPNFFIVGAVKSGTTSLYAYLAQHPDVFMPAIKEPHFFAQAQPSAEQRYLVTVINDRSAYLRLFRKARGFRAIGDASPSYLWDPQAPYRIRQVVPEARIVILLRDPVERAFAHYLMDFHEGVQDLPFYEALKRDMGRARKGWGVSQLYVELGQYADQVARYLDVFGPPQVQVLLFNELQQDARLVVERTVRFLALPAAPAAAIDTSKIHNGYSETRGAWARRLAGRPWARVIGQRLLPVGLQQFLWTRLFSRPGRKPVIDPRARELLCSIYRPEMERLESVLGRALPEMRCSW